MPRPAIEGTQLQVERRGAGPPLLLIRGLGANSLHVIHASADETIDPINGDLVASLIPGARLELLDGIGHLFF